ncbi:glycosyltransferase family 2 protein [Dyadobacter psychrotolerans]|uniref:Glycosyltransferase family 2 protein n=1 Tax=Dyadobacter psychrotolerans TaxID=2541721 RepID=A0A4R5DMT0_9BACT|nr:glycosyltransferase family 2 protein [Dyadobacter psychrotolerans]TDE12003.1 glycosyltransferase family 2 protein [Dyadobacter psychrotolerans]
MITPAEPSRSTPLVSIVMATYNGGRFLREQLDSLVAQTYPNLEIVIVDDASTDQTPAILDEYVAVYSNIQVYKAEQNLGYIRNFEKGLLLCQGEYIALCDQDDIWLAEKISILMRQRGHHSLIYCNSELIDAAGERSGVKLNDLKNLLDFWTPLNYVVGGTASGHAMLVKREVILQSVPLPSMVTHDYWIGFVATLSAPMKFVHEVLVLYRQHGGNVIGVNGGGSKATKKRKISKEERDELVRQRMKLMYEKCPEQPVEIKKVFYSLSKSYQNFSFSNNFTRMTIFFRYRKEITAYKKRSEFRRWLFCLKMFYKIE